MKSTWILIIGIAIGVLGAGTYLSSTNRTSAPTNPTADSATAANSTNHPQRSSSYRKSLWPQRQPSATARHHQPTTAEAPEEDTSPGADAIPKTRPLVKNTPRQLDEIVEPSADELARRAENIERRATMELERLTKLLDLSEEQQDRIFPLLARSSTAYHPALSIRVGNSETSTPSDLPSAPGADTPSGEPAAAEATAPESSEPLLAKEADEEIHDILTDDQKDALEEELIDEDLWWSDIIADLEDELDETTQIAATETVTESEDVEYTGNTGIGILLAPPVEESTDD